MRRSLVQIQTGPQMFSFILGAVVTIAVAALIMLVVTIVKLHNLKEDFEYFKKDTYEDEQRWHRQSVDERFKSLDESHERFERNIRKQFDRLELEKQMEIQHQPQYVIDPETFERKKVLKG